MIIRYRTTGAGFTRFFCKNLKKPVSVTDRAKIALAIRYRNDFTYKKHFLQNLIVNFFITKPIKKMSGNGSIRYFGRSVTASVTAPLLA